MKRTLLCSAIAATALVYACSVKTTDTKKATYDNNGPNPTDTTDDAGGGGGSSSGGPSAEAGPPPGSDDPSGNPILLGPARTVRTFTPPGGAPQFVDGPTWSPTKDQLYVSLPFAQNLQGGKGILTTFKKDGTNYLELRAGDKLTLGTVGNSVDTDGNIISAELKAITRTMVGSTQLVVIASGWSNGAEGAEVKPFDAPNDLVALADGTIYFTDPGYGVEPRPDQGKLYRIAAGAAVATVMASYDYNPSPNGIAVSKDQKSLYVGFTQPGETTNPYVRKYTINADHSLTDAGKFLEVPMGSEPDGLAMDDDDNLYIAMKGGIAVFKAKGAQGEPYGDASKIPQTKLDGDPTGLAFGTADRKSLFVTTTNGKVLELRTKVPGLLN